MGALPVVSFLCRIKVRNKLGRRNGMDLGQNWLFRLHLPFFLRPLSSFPLAHSNFDRGGSEDLLPVTWQARKLLAAVPFRVFPTAFRFSSSFHSIHHVPLHSQAGRSPRSFFHLLLPAKSSPQSPSSSRFALLSTRFTSTSSKQPTLKERLAALIPQEIENVCLNVLRLLPLTLF